MVITLHPMTLTRILLNVDKVPDGFMITVKDKNNKEAKNDEMDT